MGYPHKDSVFVNASSQWSPEVKVSGAKSHQIETYQRDAADDKRDQTVLRGHDDVPNNPAQPLGHPRGDGA